jgi:pimeloyl-ACP methyl ester carboxylesterase
MLKISRWGISRLRTMSDSGITCGQRTSADISDTLANAVTPLEDSYTLAYHDYREVGVRRSHRSPYTYERIADDLDGLRVHLGYERVGVLAHSMGGFIGLTYALRHPGSSGLSGSSGSSGLSGPLTSSV